MPYLTPLEKRHKILELFVNENIPRTILEISRSLGYHKPESIRTALHNLHHEGSLHRHEQPRHNNTIRYLYLMSEHGKLEFDLLTKSLYQKRFNGIR